MNINIITALVAVMGVMVGATLQYLFARRTEALKQYQTLKSQAYVDFIKATAGITIAQKYQNQEKELESTILMTDAKARIAVYGSKEVVESMAEFFREYAATTSPEAIASFIAMIQKMRNETVSSREIVVDRRIGQLLVGEY